MRNCPYRGLPPPAPPLWGPLLGKIPIRENLALCVLLEKTVVRENLVRDNFVRERHIAPVHFKFWRRIIARTAALKNVGEIDSRKTIQRTL